MTEPRTPELVITDAITNSIVRYPDNGFAVVPARAAALIMRDLKLAGYEVLDTLGDVETEVAEIMAEREGR